jgi:hypothetical protein
VFNAGRADGVCAGEEVVCDDTGLAIWSAYFSVSVLQDSPFLGILAGARMPLLLRWVLHRFPSIEIKGSPLPRFTKRPGANLIRWHDLKLIFLLLRSSVLQYYGLLESLPILVSELTVGLGDIM